MAKEYKTFTFTDSSSGRKAMNRKIDELASEGWVLTNKEVSEQGWAFGKTCCLGCLFLPLALLGKKDNEIHITMEKSVRK